MTQRTERIDELLRQEIGQALEREVTDPGIGFVTVTQVETSPDLSRARVWVSVIGSEERRKESLAALRRAMPYIRHGLGSKIRLRRIPELDVRLDDTAERGTRILKIINDLEAGRSPDEASATLESQPTPVPRLRHEGDSIEESARDAAGGVETPRRPRKAMVAGSRGEGGGAGKGGHADRARFRRRSI
jgi:ribosome-binding factor A